MNHGSYRERPRSDHRHDDHRHDGYRHDGYGYDDYQGRERKKRGGFLSDLFD